MQLVTNNAADLALLAALKVTPAATGPLLAAKAHLCQTNMSYDRNTTLADLIAGEATYDGYAAATITWGTPSISSDGTVEMVGTVPTFADTGNTTPNQIYGLFVTDSASAVLFACGAFDGAPIPMVNSTCEITVTIRWRPTQGAAVVVIS